MRWTSVAIGCAVVVAGVACTHDPRASAASGIPAAWYGVIGDAIARTPGVGDMTIVENGGPCDVRASIRVDGRRLTSVLAHGVQRLDGEIPAVLCQWYQGTPVEVTVAQAADDIGYRTLVDGAAAILQPGNVQTEQDVMIGARTLRVVRTVYPTNTAAGTDYEAFYLDGPSRGRVSLRVGNSAERSAGYDEKHAAADLVEFLDG